MYDNITNERTVEDAGLRGERQRLRFPPRALPVQVQLGGRELRGAVVVGRCGGFRVVVVVVV